LGPHATGGYKGGGYIDVVGGGSATPGAGVILVLRYSLYYLRVPIEVSLQRVVVSNGARLEDRAFGQREGVVAGRGRDACGG